MNIDTTSSSGSIPSILEKAINDIIAINRSNYFLFPEHPVRHGQPHPHAHKPIDIYRYIYSGVRDGRRKGGSPCEGSSTLPKSKGLRMRYLKRDVRSVGVERRGREVTLHVLFPSNVISKTAYPPRDY